MVSTSPEIYQIDQVDEKDKKYQKDNKDKRDKNNSGSWCVAPQSYLRIGIEIYIHHWLHLLQDKIYKTRSLGALRAPTSRRRPFGPAWLRPSSPLGSVESQQRISRSQ